MSDILKTSKQATKAQAFRLLTKLKNGGELSPIELDSLILRHAPTTPKVVKPKDAMGWLSKAVADNDLRKQLMYILVVDGIGYATNGFVIHKAKVTCEDGWYEPRSQMRVDPTLGSGENFARSYNQILTATSNNLKDSAVKGSQILVAKTPTGGMTKSKSSKKEALYNFKYTTFLQEYLDNATNYNDKERFAILAQQGIFFAYGNNAYGEWCAVSHRG